MKLETLTQSIGEWLRGTGPESDIVMSSRVRLARNVANYPFVSRATDQDRADIERFLRERLATLPIGRGLEYIDVGHLEEVDRQFLVERQLISREHADAQGARSVAIDVLEQVSLMINEEDHLRIQCMHSGLDLRGAWEQIKVVDDQIEKVVPYAFSPRWGYLTACPTNVGTGIRVSVMLHLPALVITRQIDKVFRSLHKISLAVRGLYGEGSQAMGDFIKSQTKQHSEKQKKNSWSRLEMSCLCSSTTNAAPANSSCVKHSKMCTIKSVVRMESYERLRRSVQKKPCNCSQGFAWESYLG